MNASISFFNVNLVRFFVKCCPASVNVLVLVINCDEFFLQKSITSKYMNKVIKLSKKEYLLF